MDEERLICLVSSYPELYDLENKNYMNHVRKNNIWNEISTELGESDVACKEKWKLLRDAYQRSLKRRQTKSGDGAKNTKKWRHESQMEFLRPHFQGRLSKSNIEPDNMCNDDFEEATSLFSSVSASVHSPRHTPDLETAGPSMTRTSTPTNNAIFNNITARKKKAPQASQVANVLEKYLESRSSSQPTSSRVESISPIHSFFNAMAHTVTSLSPKLQLRVKNKVYSIVSDAEAENLKQTEKTSPDVIIKTGTQGLGPVAVPDQMQPMTSGAMTLHPESPRYHYFIDSDGNITFNEN